MFPSGVDEDKTPPRSEITPFVLNSRGTACDFFKSFMFEELLVTRTACVVIQYYVLHLN